MSTLVGFLGALGAVLIGAGSLAQGIAAIVKAWPRRPAPCPRAAVCTRFRPLPPEAMD